LRRCGPKIAKTLVCSDSPNADFKEFPMIRLCFNSLAGTDPEIIGPARFFTIDGPLLQQGPDHTVVGRYFDHHWELGGRFVSSWEFLDAVCLRFVGAGGASSATYGPFQHVRFPNGFCHADRDLFAELLLDEDGAGHGSGPGAGQWLHRASLSRWPAMVFGPVEPGVKPQ
jgi:hypothetical protein